MESEDRNPIVLGGVDQNQSSMQAAPKAKRALWLALRGYWTTPFDRHANFRTKGSSYTPGNWTLKRAVLKHSSMHGTPFFEKKQLMKLLRIKKQREDVGQLQGCS